jgi:hypothetical protein
MRHPATAPAPEGQGEKSQVEDAKEQAKEKVQEASGQAQDRVREQVDQRSTQVADQAADRAERLGSYLQESDADRILRDVEDLARRQPWAVAAGGLALGFVASRFLKASSQRRYASEPARRY